MKHFLVTFSLLTSFILAQAQNNELFIKIDNFIDSCKVKKTENIVCYIQNDLKRTNLNSFPNGLELNILKSDLINVNELISYIENKYYKRLNPWVRLGVLKIFKALLENSDIDSYNLHKQKLTRLCLDNSEMGTLQFLKLYDKSCYSNHSKEIILKILNKQISKENAILQKLLSCDKSKRNAFDTLISKQTKKYYFKEAKKANLSVENWCDSINNDCLNRALNPDLNKYNYWVSNELILLIGNAYLNDFSQRLEEMLYEKEYDYLHDNIILVLGRLQYKNYEQKIIERIRKREHTSYLSINKSVNDLRYIGTQDAIFEISQFLFSKTKMFCACEQRQSDYKEYGYFILFRLCNFINGFPINSCTKIDYKTKKLPILISHEDNCFCNQTDNLPKDILKIAFKWMKKNKGKYKMEEHFYIKL